MKACLRVCGCCVGLVGITWLVLSSTATPAPPTSFAAAAPTISAAHALLAHAIQANGWFEWRTNYLGSCMRTGESQYGGITPKGMANALSGMPSPCALTPDSVFVDVGSGYGEFPFFVRAATGFRAVGVEIDPCRHAIAMRRLRSVESLLPRGRPLTYLNVDVTAPGGSLRQLNATHVFIHSTCFTKGLIKSIAHAARVAGVRCMLDLGNDDVRPQLAQAFGGVPIHVARSSTTWVDAGMPLFYYASRSLRKAHSLQPIDNLTRGTWRDRVKVALARQYREADSALGR